MEGKTKKSIEKFYLDNAELAANCQSLISPLVIPRGLEQVLTAEN
jgi:hypothetical protein